MNPVNRPYYGLHQISTGKYTSGGEYVYSSGLDYVGAYHVLPNGQVFTHFQPQTVSQELFEKRLDIADVVRKYNGLKRFKIARYVSPVSFQPFPSLDEYTDGFIFRYFVQKRNNPLYTIMEISNEQFANINTDNRPGINGNLWNSIGFRWQISLIPSDSVAQLNQKAIIDHQIKFPHLGIFLTNVLEFYK